MLGLGRVLKSWSFVEPSQKQSRQSGRRENQLLPNQISGRILDLEMECEKQSISKQLVFELIAEYTKAVQFYEEQGNDKYKLYQKRMHNFLAKPMIESILKGQSGEMVIKKERKEQTIRKAENKAEQQAKQILAKHQEKQKKHKSFIKDQIEKQEQFLEERIRRKRIMSNRSARSKNSGIVDPGPNNEESGKKNVQKMDIKILLNGIGERKTALRKVYL